MTGSWLELHMGPLAADDTEMVCGLLGALGAQGIQETPLDRPYAIQQPWDDVPQGPSPQRLSLQAAFAADVDREAVARGLRHLDVPLTWRTAADPDPHAWRRAFHPVVVTPKLTVAPPWDAVPGALIIEPGQGFGTGHHPTTLQALRLMEPLLDAKPNVLDVGCGSGILALAAARAGATAIGIDVEQPAIDNARRNAQQNGLDVSFSPTAIRDVAGTFPLVVANLHAEVLIALTPELARVSAGHLIVAGVLDDRETSVVSALSAFFSCDKRVQDDAWVAGLWRRRP